MIIEGAFLNLPELLLGHMFPHEQYEATVTDRFAMAVLFALSIRNVQLPMHLIHMEKPYPEIPGSRSPGRADLYVDLKGVFSLDNRYRLYGMKTENWIESKFFRGIDRHSGSPDKTTNAALLALDLLRLCLFVREPRSRHRENGRYLVAVFDREPRDYLAFGRRNTDFPKREWLSILSPGEHQVQISLTHELKTFRKVFGEGFIGKNRDLDLELRVLTRSFSPVELLKPSPLYWGYLIRIVDFKISINNDVLVYRDVSQEVWSEKQEEIQTRLIQTFRV